MNQNPTTPPPERPAEPPVVAAPDPRRGRFPWIIYLEFKDKRIGDDHRARCEAVKLAVRRATAAAGIEEAALIMLAQPKDGVPGPDEALAASECHLPEAAQLRALATMTETLRAQPFYDELKICEARHQRMAEKLLFSAAIKNQIGSGYGGHHPLAALLASAFD